METAAIETANATPAPVRFRADRDALFAAVSLLARHVIERRNSVPILSGVLFRPVAGGVELVGTDLDVSCALTVPAAWEAPGPFVAGAAVVADVLKKIEAGAHVELTADAGRLRIIAGRVDMATPLIDPELFPIIAGPGDGAVRFGLHSTMLAGDLALVAPMQSTDEARYYLNGVALQRGPVEEGGADRLLFVATNGGNLARIARDLPAGSESLSDVIIPRKTVAVVRQLLKGHKPVSVGLAIDGGKLAVTLPAARLVSKLIDGTFPAWRDAAAQALGDELQRVAFPDADTRLHAETLAALAKARGKSASPAIVDAGAAAARITFDDVPAFEAVSMFRNPNHASGRYQVNGGPADAHAAESYLRSLAEAAGLAPDVEGALHYGPGNVVIGATFGASTMTEGRWEETLDWSTFTTERTFIAPERVYEPGAFSVPMPAHARAAVMAGDGDELQPVGVDSKGCVALTAAQVARLAGPVEDMPRVDIPARPFWRGAMLGIGWMLPTPPKIARRAALRMTTEEQAAYGAACAPVYVGEGMAPATPYEHGTARAAVAVAVEAAPAVRQPRKARTAPAEAVAAVPAPSEPVAPVEAPAAPVAAVEAAPAVEGAADLVALVRQLVERVEALTAEVAALRGNAPAVEAPRPSLPAGLRDKLKATPEPLAPPIERRRVDDRQRTAARMRRLRAVARDAETARLDAADAKRDRNAALARLDAALDEASALRSQLADARRDASAMTYGRGLHGFTYGRTGMSRPVTLSLAA